MYFKHLGLALPAMGLLVLSEQVHAASFSIANSETRTNQQVLNRGEAGTNTSGGTLLTPGTAIRARGNNIVTNDGIILTTGDNAEGVFSSGPNSTITNNNTLSTTGFKSDGVFSSGSNATILNTGIAGTTGRNAKGIFSTGSNATLTNNGTITTSGLHSQGIRSKGRHATIENSGIISTTGNNAAGIHSTGSNATIINNGTISTIGQSQGVFSSGFQSTITNNGAISTRNGHPAILAIGPQSTINQHAGEIKGNVIAPGGLVNIFGGSITGNVNSRFVNVRVDKGSQFNSYGINTTNYDLYSGKVNQIGNFSADRTRVFHGATLSFSSPVFTNGVVESYGNLEFVLSSNNLSNNPLLTTNGPVILDENSNVVIRAESGDLHGQNLRLINTPDLHTRFASVDPTLPAPLISSSPANINIIDNSLLYRFSPQVNTVFSTELSVTAEVEDLSRISSNANASSFGAGITQAAIAGQGGAVADYLAQLGNNDIAGFERAADVFSPSVSGAVTQGSREANEASQRLITDRLLSSLDNGNSGLWFQGFASKADQDRVDDVEGYQSNTRGFALGYDHQLNNNWGIGAAYSYGEVDADNDRFANDSIDIDSQQLSFYGIYRQNDWYTSAILSYAELDYDLQRRNLLPGQSRISGSTDGDLWSAEVAAGKNYQMGIVTVTPTVGLAYSRLSVDKYTEKGGLNANIDYGQSEELESELAVVFSGQQSYGNWVMTPSARVSWFHEFLDDDANVKAQFAGGSFSQEGADTDQDTFGVGLGVNLAHKSGVSLSLDLDSKLNDDYKSHTGSLSLKYNF